MKSKAYLRIRGWKQDVRIDDPKVIAPLVLQSMTNLPLWSYDALRKLHIGLQEMIIDFCIDQRQDKKGSERAKYTRMISRAENAIQYTRRDRDALLQTLYDSILSAEGMARLAGFGITNQFKDNIRGNPEVHPLKIIDA